MKLYVNESGAIAQNAGAQSAVAVDDLILTVALPTTAGSKMLDGYQSLFDAEAVAKLEGAGIPVAGKANIGEFGVDLLGETSYFGACENAAGELTSAATELVGAGAVRGVVGLDVNGAQRRAAALSGQVCVKPTYGTVSRFGTVAVACSGEAVCVTGQCASECRELLGVLAGHDGKDGTSLPQASCDALKADAPRQAVQRVAVLSDFVDAADEAVQARVAAAVEALQGQGIACEKVFSSDSANGEALAVANAAWNILMSAELCNNVSRFDGVKYGYRSDDFMSIGELYTNSRTEAFGTLLKTLILFGSDVLSDENYYPMYDKALRIRRLVCQRFAEIFECHDAVLLPACGKPAYTKADVEADRYLALSENKYTAPASISGLPAVVAGGVQLMGPALSDQALLDAAEKMVAELEKKEVR